MATSESRPLTLRDRLSRLSFRQAAQLLNPNGVRRLNTAGRLFASGDFDLDRDVRLDDRVLRVDFPDAPVTVSLSPEHVNRLAWQCDACGAGTGAGAEADELFDAKTCRHVPNAIWRLPRSIPKATSTWWR